MHWWRLQHLHVKVILKNGCQNRYRRTNQHLLKIKLLYYLFLKKKLQRIWPGISAKTFQNVYDKTSNIYLDGLNINFYGELEIKVFLSFFQGKIYSTIDLYHRSRPTYICHFLAFIIDIISPGHTNWYHFIKTESILPYSL